MSVISHEKKFNLQPGIAIDLIQKREFKNALERTHHRYDHEMLSLLQDAAKNEPMRRLLPESNWEVLPYIKFQPKVSDGGKEWLPRLIVPVVDAILVKTVSEGDLDAQDILEELEAPHRAKHNQ